MVDGKERFYVYLPTTLVNRLEEEILRRRKAGENVGPDGKKVHLNRSSIIRELIEQHLV